MAFERKVSETIFPLSLHPVGRGGVFAEIGKWHETPLHTSAWKCSGLFELVDETGIPRVFDIGSLRCFVVIQGYPILPCHRLPSFSFSGWKENLFFGKDEGRLWLTLLS